MLMCIALGVLLPALKRKTGLHDLPFDKEKLSYLLGRLKRMEPPFEGGCDCGEFRYRCTEAPFWSSNCYCRSCQLESASQCSTAFTIPVTGFEILSGVSRISEREADSGQVIQTVRCRNCDTWIYAGRRDGPEWLGVLAATLDDPSNFATISNVYVSEAPSTAILDPDLLQFRKMPQDEL